jgi:hypothetical protein
MMHLYIALIFWALGLAMILFPAQFPEFLQRRIVNTQLSAGWIFVLFGTWHLARWWLGRGARRRAGPQREPPPRRAHADQEYHPEFDFDQNGEGPERPA